MKTLVLVRHAKSDWSDISISDFDRPLNEKGLNEAPLMAELLSSKGLKPNIMISSPALRAITTAGFFADAFNFSKDDIVLEQEIYSKGAMEVIDIISNIQSSNSTAFVFGHNPYITTIASYLTSIQFDEVPTCGVVCIDFVMKDWVNIPKKIGKLRFYDFPKMIRGKK